MDQAFLIRRLNQTDLPAFYQLRLESLQNAPASYLSSYEDEKAVGCLQFEKFFQENQEEYAIFGAFLEHNLIGCVAMFQEAKSKLRHKCTIWGVYVQSAYRNQHLARQLMGAALSHAKNNMKCSIINLTVETNNLAAKKLYDSLGFIVWGTEKNAVQFDRHFHDEFYMAFHFIK